MNKLLPCPFCGSPAKLNYTDGSYGYYSGKYNCQCTSCGVCTRSFDDEEYSWERRKHSDVTEAAKKDAVDVWNKRV